MEIEPESGGPKSASSREINESFLALAGTALAHPSHPNRRSQRRLMYYRHFRLSGPPFEAVAGPEALYLSRAHRESLAAFEWGLLHEPSGFTTLTGEIGTGKTTLVSSILARNFEQLRAAYVINPKLSFEDILRVVLGQFGVPCMGTKLDRIEALAGYLGGRMPHERLAIIVDEAQDLSDDALEELRLLSNYGQRLGRYLQLVLVGQPELAARLNSPQLRQFNQRIAARSVLTRLSFAEAHEYVSYRLRAREGRSEEIFSPDALDYLLRHSVGIPRQINVLCHNAMLLAYSAGRPRVELKAARTAVAEYGESLFGGLKVLTNPSKWQRPALAGAALGLLLFTGYVYKDLSGNKPQDTQGNTLRNDGDASFIVAQDTKAAFKSIAERVAASLPGTAHPGSINAQAETVKASGTWTSPGNQQTQQLNTDSTVVPISADRQQAADSASASAPGETISHTVHASTLPEATEVDGKRSVLVKYGDTLENLALQHLGSRNALNALIEANPQITDINKIFPGQKIYLSDRDKPDVRPVSAARVASRPSTAYPNDTVRNDASNALESTRAAGDK